MPCSPRPARLSSGVASPLAHLSCHPGTPSFSLMFAHLCPQPTVSRGWGLSCVEMSLIPLLPSATVLPGA